MKKIYQNPELKIVKIQPMKMLLTSGETPVEGFEQSLGTQDKSGVDALSRRRGFSWNDGGDDDSSEDNAW